MDDRNREKDAHSQYGKCNARLIGVAHGSIFCCLSFIYELSYYDPFFSLFCEHQDMHQFSFPDLLHEKKNNVLR